MNVLSLFDGISCGRLALQEAGIKVDNYYASEIDGAAIGVSNNNFPDIIHLGDVSKISYKNGCLITENGIFDVGQIDLLIGGSPCQSFSKRGNQKSFDDSRGKLIYEFERILRETSAPYFLLENVVMNKAHQDVISRLFGVEPLEINSALVTAQNRLRLYWTNIEGVEIPSDSGVMLQDVLENGYTERDKAYCITATYSNATAQNYFINKERQLKFKHPVKKTGNRYILYDGTIVDIYPAHGLERNYYSLQLLKPYMSKLSCEEVERLQGIPVGYTAGVANHVRYKLLGNAWTVPVVSHILGYITEQK
ncbi:DNA (cytosine-5-)-methyltransferase [Pontibacter chinhatensis]|uniref:DNA (cytosine-5-)-methyltransferase n=1 Tax=Pontibacter chinhatensis TaxID=1436961 RepID=A0A1I2ZSA8_9BACT|nr:DNA (cytosine-5-)-methyltransferase [Pontibacter chinhatensis]SFH40399.1 DNA (cytosine-5)-methyltransferase 3A [Pontibacter chinhatensis]